MPKLAEEANKALVLEAFDTLFNKRDYKAAEHASIETSLAGPTGCAKNCVVAFGHLLLLGGLRPECGTSCPGSTRTISSMSPIGPKRTSRMHQWMSAFGGKADIAV
jgi:hypothetical protein